MILGSIRICLQRQYHHSHNRANWKAIAEELGLPAGIPVAYRAGDQPNNALSLNVLEPGEVAATAGTSGVIYGVTDQKKYDPLSRVNTFLHVNHSEAKPRLGVLLCINGTGILNSWLRRNASNNLSYEQMNELAEKSRRFGKPFNTAVWKRSRKDAWQQRHWSKDKWN